MMLGDLLKNNREFFPAEDALVKGAQVYEDAVSRSLLKRSADYGKIYAELGDIEYFTKGLNSPASMRQAVRYYSRAQDNGYTSPETDYRWGAALYHLQDWDQALKKFFNVSLKVPYNRRLLLAAGNASYMRSDYWTAQGYYERLTGMLEDDHSHYLNFNPMTDAEQADLAERMMIAYNNLGAAMEMAGRRSGSAEARTQAMADYSQSSRIWDMLNRNPVTLTRPNIQSLSTPGVNMAFLNTRNTLYPTPDVQPQIYPDIDADVVEPSTWEELLSK
jgi:tetratricopeptide (TPR) repeat protein